jgi:hypothetical protein
LNPSCTKKGWYDTLFHEFLHECDYGEPYRPPYDPTQYDPRAEEACRACTGKPSCKS